jgi:hypothetical protein
MIKLKLVLWTALPLLALGWLSGCSLSADITPPPGLPTLPAAAVAPATAQPPTAAVAEATAAVGSAAGTPAATTEPVTVTVAVSGTVNNGTANGAVPADQQVFLHTFDPQATSTSMLTYSTTVLAGNTFAFDNIPAQVGSQFVVSARYQNVDYASQTATLAANQAKLDMPVTIYETTTDASQVSVEQMHVFLDFSAGQVTVGELYILSNGSDRTVAKAQGSTEYAVPAGATNFAVQGEQEGTDYVRTAQGFAQINPLMPGTGSGQMLYTFDLPYSGTLSFEQKLIYPVKAAGVLLPDVGVALQSSQLQSQGTQNVQGSTYLLYGASSLAPGSSLAFQLSGQVGSGSALGGAAQPGGAPQTAASANDFRPIAAGVGVLGVVVLGIGVWLYRRQTRAAGGRREASDEENLLQAIADLDDDFEQERLDAAVYARRRARLKSKLAEVMAGRSSGEQAK